MIDGLSYVYGIILGGTGMLALGYSWGRFDERSRANERKGYVGPKVTTPPTAQQMPAISRRAAPEGTGRNEP
jgi:hypothetical protein